MVEQVKIDHSTVEAFIDELSTWNRADPTTKNKNRPSITGPTGIFSSFVYIKMIILQFIVSYPKRARSIFVSNVCLKPLSNEFLLCCLTTLIIMNTV